MLRINVHAMSKGNFTFIEFKNAQKLIDVIAPLGIGIYSIATHRVDKIVEYSVKGIALATP